MHSVLVGIRDPLLAEVGPGWAPSRDLDVDWRTDQVLVISHD
jgi:hypothetical protein